MKQKTSIAVDTDNAVATLEGVVQKTPLMKNWNVSKEHQAQVWLKREDLQTVRSYKIRGAFNKIASLKDQERLKGVVCASAGNHAQGVAYACRELEIKGVIFMPCPTPKQKIDQVEMFGEGYIEVILVGDTFDDSKEEALRYKSKHQMVFVHPFDDQKVIEGQSTVAHEILTESIAPIDYLFLPVGGGGLAAGVSSYFKKHSPNTKVVGVEPAGAASMSAAMNAGETVKLESISKFIDGASVKEVGQLNLDLCKTGLDEMALVEEGKVCSTLLKLYNKDAIVAEPAGALSLAVLDQYQDQIKGKNVVCIVSGGNNDITRMEEIKERSLLFEGLKHYFLVNFPQRAGALRDFVNNVLGPQDDITHFQYMKKHNREKGPVTIGIQLTRKDDLQALEKRMTEHGFQASNLNNKPDLFQILI